MLYDPKWEKQTETKPDLFSRAEFLAWLEQHPSSLEYDYYDCNGACLVGQYMAAQGQKWSHPVFWDLSAAGFNRVAAGWPRNFGGALKRARKWMAEDAH